MKKYILTIDQGTTSTRSILFDNKSNIVSISQMEIEQICPSAHPETLCRMTNENLTILKIYCIIMSMT